MATFFGLLAKMTVHFLVKKPWLLWLSFFGLLGDLINSHSYVYYVINCMAALIFCTLRTIELSSLAEVDRCTLVFAVPLCHSPQLICGHSLLVNRFTPLGLSLRCMMYCVTEGEFYAIFENQNFVYIIPVHFYKVVNMEQKAAAKQLFRHPSIDYSWIRTKTLQHCCCIAHG